MVATVADVGPEAGGRSRFGTHQRFPTAMVAATLAMLAAGFALQLVAFRDGGQHALSDLPGVYLHRHVGTGGFPYIDRALEYPVGAGILLYVAALIAPSPMGVLVVTALASTAVCVWITVALERRCGTRAWRWALASPVLLFAFQNWDVFAIGAMLVGLLAFERRRDVSAGAAFALGAVVKLFPAVLVPPLAAVRWAEGDRRGAWRLVLSAAAVFAVLNLPVLVASPRGWWWPFAFQGRRGATWGTAWIYLERLVGLPETGAAAAHVANLVSLVALVLGLGWLIARTVSKPLTPSAVACAAVAIMLLSNKVYSPTYDVWLVVFFVLVPLSRRLWIAFCAVDLAIYVTVYAYFGGLEPSGVAHGVLPALVLVRTLVLVTVVLRATRSTTSTTGESRLAAAASNVIRARDAA
jgi:uncharacterized membrane protein